MTVEEMIASVETDAGPPPRCSAPQRALWLARKGSWDAAHDVVNDLHTPMGSWIHAHLHRIEGDLANSAYWYAKAGREAIRHPGALDDEWRDLVRANTGANTHA